MSEPSADGTGRVPPLNMTWEERRTLLHCIVAGEEAAVEHFGEEEAERIESLKEKLGYPLRTGIDGQGGDSA